MADALSVLSLADAKDYLAIDYNDMDAVITSAIYSMVSLVEQITNYRLYQRTETIECGIQKYQAFQFPINNIVSVTDNNGYASVYRLEKLPLRWVFTFQNAIQYFYANDYPEFSPSIADLNTIVLDVGYADPTKTPPELIAAIKLLVTEVIENRVPTKEQMPNDISLLLSPYLRFTYF
jgi:uncharacterized phiE125 gp8 family phage protein